MVYNKNLSSQCNLTAQIEPLQDKTRISKLQLILDIFKFYMQCRIMVIWKMCASSFLCTSIKYIIMYTMLTINSYKYLDKSPMVMSMFVWYFCYHFGHIDDSFCQINWNIFDKISDCPKSVSNEKLQFSLGDISTLILINELWWRLKIKWWMWVEEQQ